MWQRIWFASGGAEMIVGASMQIWPDLMPIWLSYLVILLGALTIFDALFVGPVSRAMGIQPVMRFLPMWSIQFKRKDSWPFRRLVVLDKAIWPVYEKIKETLIVSLQKRLEKDSSKLPRIIAEMLIGDGKIPVFGYFLNSSKFSEIPNEEHKQLQISDNAKEFYVADDPDQSPRYTGLAIKKKDIHLRTKEILNGEW